MNIIYQELNKLGITYDSVSILQDKDGVIVSRIIDRTKSYVLKCFQKEDHKRELQNYCLLETLGVPTIQVIASTDCALLLEDIERSPIYRMGVEEDMSDPEVARCIAVWYKKLHKSGYDYVRQYGQSMYDESDFFSRDHISFVKEKTGTQSLPAWELLEQNFDAIYGFLQKVRRTLTYNDFYYTNMIVAKDKSAAMMFDYNLLGKGYAYTDIENVLCSMSDEAKEAFLHEYGEYDPAEKALNNGVSVVVSLYMACQRDEFPWWAQEILEEVNTTFAEKIRTLQKLLY